MTVPGASTTSLEGRVVGIADGDTLTLLAADRQQVRIRLAEIDTPERGLAWGIRARKALADRVFQKQVRVDVIDIDRYGRTVGRVYLNGRDVNRELVREGHAWVYRQYMTDRSVLDDEATARAADTGLWSLLDPIPPWEWRHGARGASAAGKTLLGDQALSCGSKRYCRQMRGCAEAEFYLTECRLARLDGDRDGTPCESICR